jgi:hypothetical protein
MKWRHAAHLAAIAVSVIILAVLVRDLDVRQAFHAVAHSQWGWVLAAAAINLLNTAVESVRWSIPASSVKPGLRIPSAFRALLAGTLGNIVLPMKLGDGVRAYVFADAEGIPLASAVSTVVLDRMVDICAFLIVVMLTLIVYPLPEGVLHVTRNAFAGLAAAAVLFVVVLRAGRRRGALATAGRRSRLLVQLERFAEGLSALGRGGLIVPAFALALLSWLTRLMVIWTAFRAFHLALPLADAAAVLVIVNVGIAVVAAPGNVGPFELAVVSALTLLSVPKEIALSYAVTLHVAEVLPPALLGLVLVWRGRLDLRRAERAAEGIAADASSDGDP